MQEGGNVVAEAPQERGRRLLAETSSHGYSLLPELGQDRPRGVFEDALDLYDLAGTEA